MSLPLHQRLIRTGPPAAVDVAKVADIDVLATGRVPIEHCLLWQDDLSAGILPVGIEALAAGVFGAGHAAPPVGYHGPWWGGGSRRDLVAPGDVVGLAPEGGLVTILWRRGSRANTLLATERCNSLCLMCSQPPREVDDTHRVEHLTQIITLIDPEETQLGISGGEPTLLDDGLIEVIRTVRRHLPGTSLHVLSNGRRFADPGLARAMAGAAPEAVTWGIPLYGDVASLHDHVVQAEGAFAETMAGLYNLAAVGATVEIRVVLTRPTVARLEALARFIYRALPFAAHIAFMGLEPMGFARRNRALIWIDPADYAGALSRAVHRLAALGMTVSIYNLPLCVLPADLLAFARASISDWKNDFAPACAPCPARQDCAGFFTSADSRWIGRDVGPLDHWPPAAHQETRPSCPV